MSAHEALATAVPADMRAVWAASMMPFGSVAAMLARAGYRFVRFHVSRFPSAETISSKLVADLPSVAPAATRLRAV